MKVTWNKHQLDDLEAAARFAVLEAEDTRDRSHNGKERDYYSNEDRAKDRRNVSQFRRVETTLLEQVRRAPDANAGQSSDVIESALEAALVALGRHGGNSEPTYANGKLLDDQARTTRNAWLQVRAALGLGPVAKDD